MQPCSEGITGSSSNANIPDGGHTLYVRAKDSFGDYGQVKTHKWKVGKFELHERKKVLTGENRFSW